MVPDEEGEPYREGAEKQHHQPFERTGWQHCLFENGMTEKTEDGRCQAEAGDGFRRHAGKAPRVVLNACNESCLEVVSLDDLKRYAIDLN